MTGVFFKFLFEIFILQSTLEVKRKNKNKQKTKQNKTNQKQKKRRAFC